MIFHGFPLIIPDQHKVSDQPVITLVRLQTHFTDADHRVTRGDADEEVDQLFATAGKLNGQHLLLKELVGAGRADPGAGVIL